MFGSTEEKLQRLAQKKQSGKIATYLKNRDQSVRLAAIKALGEAGGEDGFNNLTFILSNAAAEERVAAAEALSVLGDDKAIAYVQHQMTNESDPKLAERYRQCLLTLKKPR